MTSWEGTTGGSCDDLPKAGSQLPACGHAPPGQPGHRQHCRHLAEGLEDRRAGSEQLSTRHPLGQKENL